MTAAIIPSASRKRQAWSDPRIGAILFCLLSRYLCARDPQFRSRFPLIADRFPAMFSFFAHLVCTKCGRVHERDCRFGVCPAPECGGPLFARYHDRPLDRDAFADRPRTMWRWREMMPVEDPKNVVTLGEGGTPLLRADRLGTRAGFSDLWIKDESGNPTGSFKARGLSAAVSKAKELGFQRISLR